MVDKSSIFVVKKRGSRRWCGTVEVEFHHRSREGGTQPLLIGVSDVIFLSSHHLVKESINWIHLYGLIFFHEIDSWIQKLLVFKYRINHIEYN